MRTVVGIVLACSLICSAAFLASSAARRRLNSSVLRASRIHLILLALEMLVLAFVQLLISIPTQFGLSGGAVEAAFWSMAVFTLLLIFAQVYVASARYPHISGGMGLPIPMGSHTWLYGDVASQYVADGHNGSSEQK